MVTGLKTDFAKNVKFAQADEGSEDDSTNNDQNKSNE